jgi:outer membrane lipoprotein-sorting protein
MVDRNDIDHDNLLQQVIEHLRQQEVPEFPDPEIAVLKNVNSRRSSVRLTSMLGRMAMSRRLQLSAWAAIGLAAALAFILLSTNSTTRSASAMEQMAEKIRQARTFKAKVIGEMTVPRESGEAPATITITGTVYSLLPGAGRVDFTTHVSGNAGPHPDRQFERRHRLIEEDGTQIDLVGKPGITIDHKAKTFMRQPPQRGLYKFQEMIEKLGQFAGQADRELGSKQINGKNAIGFQIDIKKLGLLDNDPADGQPTGTAEIWIDSKSYVPLFFQFNFQGGSGRSSPAAGFSRMENFQWDVELDPKLFDTTPPDGYKDNSPEPVEQQANLSLEQRVRRITEGLKIFANGLDNSFTQKGPAGELFNGRYPKLSTVTKAGQILQWVDKSGKVKTTHFGLPEIAFLLQNNPGAAYYGETVKPSDKDKVLLRWQLDDGRYEVIFGDLRAETVTEERLRALETK